MSDEFITPRNKWIFVIAGVALFLGGMLVQASTGLVITAPTCDSQTTRLNLEIDDYFYIIDVQDDPEYENRTAKVVGMQMYFMMFDYDGFEAILNYLAEDNCMNVTDPDEIKEITGMNDFVSGINMLYWLGNFIFFDEPVDDIRGSTETITQGSYLIPYFIIFFEWNGHVEEVYFTFEDIADFFDAMSGDIICEEDVEGVHFLHGCSNNFVFKGVEWDSIDDENSTASVSYNGVNMEMVYTEAFLP